MSVVCIFAAVNPARIYRLVRGASKIAAPYINRSFFRADILVVRVIRFGGSKPPPYNLIVRSPRRRGGCANSSQSCRWRADMESAPTTRDTASPYCLCGLVDAGGMPPSPALIYFSQRFFNHNIYCKTKKITC